MKTVTVVYDIVTNKVRRIEIDATSKLARDERARTVLPSVYEQLASHSEVAKALGLN